MGLFDVDTQIRSKTSLNAVKNDADIASALSLKHAAHSDDQDLSGKADLVNGKIPVSQLPASPPDSDTELIIDDVGD